MKRLLLLACAAAALVPPARAADPLPPDLALVPRGAVWVAHVRVGDVRKDPASVLARATVLRALPKAFADLDGQFAPKPSTFDRVTAFSLTVPAPAGLEPPKVGAAAARADDPPLPPAPAAPPEVKPAAAVPTEDFGVILRCSAPFDRRAVVAGFGKDAKLEKTGGRDVYTDPAGAFAVGFVDDVTAVFGTKPAVLAVVGPVQAEQKGNHPLLEALTAAADPAHALTVGVADAKLFPVPIVPPGDSFKDVRTALLTVDLAADPVVNGRVRFTTAGAAEKAVADVLEAGKKSKEFLGDRKAQAQKQLAGDPAGPGPRPLADLPNALDGLGTLAGIEWLENILSAPPLVRDGDTVSFKFAVHPLFARFIAPVLSWSALSAPGTALGGRPEGWPGMLFPAGGTGPARIDNNLKQLALAAYNYESAMGKLPATTGTDKADKPLLSWRVAILPYIEQENLYRKFKLDEPWDSAHNKKVLADNPMPSQFAVPGVTGAADKVTHYQAFVGNGALFDRTKGTTIPSISDGTSNTVMFALAKTPVEWTKPDDIPFDPKADPTKLLAAFNGAGRLADKGVFWVAVGDGSVRTLKATIKPETLRALITRAGGEVASFND